MTNNSECCEYFKLIYDIFNYIFQLNTYQEVYRIAYKNEVVPEIWKESWIHWGKRILKENNKQFIKSFIDGFFDFLKINQIFHEDMDDEEINEYVSNRKNYFPTNTYIMVQTYIPSIVYKITIINEKIHNSSCKVKKACIFKKYVMSSSYYRREEIPLRIYNNYKDTIIDNWVLTNSFYYDYKNPVDTFLVPS